MWDSFGKDVAVRTFEQETFIINCFYWKCSHYTWNGEAIFCAITFLNGTGQMIF